MEENTLQKQLEAKLLLNPKYSSDWITAAAKLMSKYDYAISYLDQFDADQLEVIVEAEEYHDTHGNMEIITILNPSLNSTQMQLMLAAYKNNIPTKTITSIVNVNTPYSVSNYILQAFIEGHDMLKYVKYNPDQVYEIFAGLHNNVDVSKYDNKLISAELMGIMRHALECNFNAVYNFDTNEILISKN